MSYHLQIYRTASELPESWNSVIGKHNIMLSREYFNILEISCPKNMKCYFMAVFSDGDKELVGGALFQYLDFIGHQTFQESGFLYSVRNFFTKWFNKDILILGNNMLTGQNGFYFDTSRITVEEVILLLEEAVQKMQKEIRKTAMVIYKDYQPDFIRYFQGKSHSKYFRFSVQPNMILRLKENWMDSEDYINAFSTKYRSRAQSARKKNIDIEKAELSLRQIHAYRREMNILYQNVAENASFNTFFLAEDHFESMKEYMNEKFRVFGYFSGEKLIGFYTLILNNRDIDTYFLGYDKLLQKEKQLYLNMLLDMVEFGINNRFSRIIFGRTALEIKSTIGAEPTEIFGLIKHRHPLINYFMKNIFPYVSPETDWIQRKPFK
ncbi:8-amino-7-oxononanoate synthase [Chryseobacterium sp. SSA4.19]|uniref:8-amino-7-oxononanoate synthase n=1 Tax=Chryseobacterium sp. SSA4.19 TaxID=2919915 RepID=UPI001F4F1403|nr:8-amino-7-oxononanoate synthase [Chryseobacterium sp. SSA4.19]MCJ8152170.1 8-amino-7-oxononanoate synthase [Chryseobacterium sp. SSA4.19]